jgi:hypothetical protein
VSWLHEIEFLGAQLKIFEIRRKCYMVQLTAHQTIHFGLCSALISRALALTSNCKCTARYIRILCWPHIHTTHALSSKGWQRPSRSFTKVFSLYQLFSYVVEVTGGEPIVVWFYYIIILFFYFISFIIIILVITCEVYKKL